MKKRMIFVIVCIVMHCPFSLSLRAQDFQSCSAMQGSGSMYTPQVMPVGAMEAPQQATTTSDICSPKRVGSIRRADFGEGQEGGYQDPGSPVGEAWCLLAFAVLFTLRIAHKNLFNKKAKQ